MRELPKVALEDVSGGLISNSGCTCIDVGRIGADELEEGGVCLGGAPSESETSEDDENEYVEPIDNEIARITLLSSNQSELMGSNPVGQLELWSEALSNCKTH